VFSVTDKATMEKLLNLAIRSKEITAWEWNIRQKKITTLFGFNSILLLPVTQKIYRVNRLSVYIKKMLNEGQYYSLLESFRNCRTERTPLTLSFLIDFKEQGKKWLKLTAQPEVKNGEVITIVGTLQDITAAKKLQDLYQSARSINEESPMSLFLIKKEGTIYYANREAHNTLGYTQKELLASNIIAHNTKYTKRIWQQVWQKIRGRKSYIEESLFQKKDHTIIPVRIKGSYIHQTSQSYACLYVQNISLEKKQQIQLAKLGKELKDFEGIREPSNRPLPTAKIRQAFPTIITQNTTYLKSLDALQKGAATDTIILILGETGTGKELLADAIHDLSHRKTKPFIKVNCATLPDTLIESELFGYEKGAFTGADSRKSGRFELAHEGTLFLDEIGELPFSVQSKLLRVLQDGTFERIGGIKTTKVDVRIIAATNQHLLRLVEQGQFRKDLYYRLNIFPVHSIPLRQRKDDIPLLATYFLKKFSQQYGKTNLKFSKPQLAELTRYSYPGNIRELEAILQRAVILSANNHLSLRDAFQHTQPSSEKEKQFLTFESMQQQHIIQALERTNWRVSGDRGAAKLLDLNPNTLETKMRRLGIKRPK